MLRPKTEGWKGCRELGEERAQKIFSDKNKRGEVGQHTEKQVKDAWREMQIEQQKARAGKG